MKKLLFTILCFWGIISSTVLAQESKKKIFFRCPDKVFYNYEQYMLDRSFLSSFKEYKNMYPDLQVIEIFFTLGKSGDQGGQLFVPIWLIHDSQLYLIGMDFFQKYDEGIPRKRFKKIEELTGQKFEKRSLGIDVPELAGRGSAEGVMEAGWVTGVFYMKKIRYDGEPYIQWLEKGAILKLTIENGKVLKMEEL